MAAIAIVEDISLSSLTVAVCLIVLEVCWSVWVVAGAMLVVVLTILQSKSFDCGFAAYDVAVCEGFGLSWVVFEDVVVVDVEEVLVDVVVVVAANIPEGVDITPSRLTV